MPGRDAGASGGDDSRERAQGRTGTMMPASSNEPEGSRVERPRVEPEILPPERNGRGGWPPYGYRQGNSTHRVFVTRIGPFGFTLAMLVVGLFAAILLLLLIGTALLWLPFVAAIVIIGAVAGLLRRL
jgi:hypothetical protein